MRTKRRQQDLNLRRQSLYDFQSYSLTTRTQRLFYLVRLINVDEPIEDIVEDVVTEEDKTQEQQTEMEMPDIPIEIELRLKKETKRKRKFKPITSNKRRKDRT